MRVLIDFFALRPVFTIWGIRLIWLLILTQQALFTASAFSGMGRFGPRALFDLFNVALHVVLARLLLDVAGAILLRSPPVDASSPEGKLGVEPVKVLIDFFALRPVFTIGGLRLVWILVLAQYVVVYSIGDFSSGGVRTMGVWFLFIGGFFSMALHLALVRLLIEVARAVLVRRTVETSSR